MKRRTLLTTHDRHEDVEGRVYYRPFPWQSPSEYISEEDRRRVRKWDFEKLPEHYRETKP